MTLIYDRMTLCHVFRFPMVKSRNIHCKTKNVVFCHNCHFGGDIEGREGGAR